MKPYTRAPQGLSSTRFLFIFIGLIASLLGIFWLSACAPALTPAPRMQNEPVANPVESAPTSAPAPAEPQAEGVADAVSQPEGENVVLANNPAPAEGRLIIKDGQIKLLVEDSEIAIDRITLLVSDLGGYVVNSRVWYTEFDGKNYKQAVITAGVPVTQFEKALSRLRELSVQVLDESASGQDVTNEYVDLESRIRNLEATRDRIREFLEQAKTVEEALKINEQLAQVESEIEQVQGRIQYLAGRAAFSSLTIEISPKLPDLTPTPTRTEEPTPTPTQWSPGESFEQASDALTSTYQSGTEFLIWIGVLVIPVLLPFVLVGWGIYVLSKRFGKQPPKE
ncbi:MAG TPA: DUF4349 domain-containing protein [Anaerolineales bacterium]|nr:DUF4349 domain-containing protein [Anaerolineales bacterium]